MPPPHAAAAIDRNWHLGSTTTVDQPRGKSLRDSAPRRVRLNSPSDAVLTADDLVAYLKLPQSTVYRLAQEGQIPGHKVGKHWRFHRAVIDRWLANEPRGKDPLKGEAPS